MRRVLILEQEAFLGALLGERFRRSGFSVQLCGGVLADAPDLVTVPPDLLVVGTHEPGTLERLGSWVSQTPMIVLGESQAALPAWLFPTLDKPFSPNRLVELASRYLLAQKLHEHELSAASPDHIGIIPIS